MMADRYHYDRHGNYKGKTSDDPPSNDGWVYIIGFIIFAYICSGGC